MINFNKIFNYLKKSNNKFQIFNKEDIHDADLKKAFDNQGFFIIKNFFDGEYIKEIKKITDQTLEIETNIMKDRVLTDACNHNEIFNDIVLNSDLDFINKKILGDDYIFLQTFDLHANQNAHQWHRDIATKTGNVVEYMGEKTKLVKYAIYLEVKNSIFAVIPESNNSNKRNDLFGKDIYLNDEKYSNTIDNEFYNNDKILFIHPEPGDLVAFDFRLLHCACNVDSNLNPSNKNQYEKKVIWPAFGAKGNLSEIIYQYFRYVRKDFGEADFDSSTENKFDKKNLLPKNYKKFNSDYIKWIEENLMFPEQFKSMLYLKENDKKVLDYRMDYYKEFIVNSKYKLLAEKNKLIAEKNSIS